MTLARLLHPGTFRLSVIFSAACILSGVLLFAAIYWQTESFEKRRIAAFVTTETTAVAQGSANEISWTVQMFTHEHYDGLHSMNFSGLFTPDHHLIAGNLDDLPLDFPADGTTHEIALPRSADHPSRWSIIVAARYLPDGNLLVLGRGLGVVDSLEDIVAKTLLLGAIPTIAPALLIGLWLSRQAQRRVKAVNQSIERIMQGAVHERLPLQGIEDDFDQLATSVNRMLAEIQRLLAEVQGVGDNIAHDLRTPLARVRTLLERGRDKAASKDDMIRIAGRAIAGLDQAQSIITALLRIGEIEGGQRRSAFCNVDLSEIACLAAELYTPIAEEKRINLLVQADATSQVVGDRDLLVEAIANLLDNAIKFATVCGDVRLLVADALRGPVIRVIDNGPGIPAEERAAVMTRFYRIDKSRHIKGSGLGLSIVLAIVKLHDFDIVVEDAGPGCMFELRCYPPARVQIVPAPAGRRLKLPWVHRVIKQSADSNCLLTSERADSLTGVAPDRA